ncbi:MAG: hypothetical protein AAF501_20855 [Pseudomonadota bacterium]
MTPGPRWIGRLVAAELVRDGWISAVLTDGAPPDPWLVQTGRPLRWFAPEPSVHIRGNLRTGWREAYAQPAAEFRDGLAVAMLPPGTSTSEPASEAMHGGVLIDPVEELGFALLSADATALGSVRLVAEQIRDDITGDVRHLAGLVECIALIAESIIDARLTSDGVLRICLDPLSCLAAPNGTALRPSLLGREVTTGPVPVRLAIPRFGGDPANLSLHFGGPPPLVEPAGVLDGSRPDHRIVALQAVSCETTSISLCGDGYVPLLSVTIETDGPEYETAQDDFPDPLDAFGRDPFREGGAR